MTPSEEQAPSDHALVHFFTALALRHIWKMRLLIRGGNLKEQKNEDGKTDWTGNLIGG
jgi:hypothetical protein